MEDARQNDCCLNCQAVLPEESKFCPNCGQKRIRPEDHSVWHLIVESVGDFFHFESKFFATLWPLFFRPGFLTNEYLEGKRARYFQPFKLFLFISFIFFLTTGLMNHKSISDPELTKGQNKLNTNIIINGQETDKLRLDDAYNKIFAFPDDSLRNLVNKQGLNRFVQLRYPQASWYTRFMLKQLIKNKLQGSGTLGENMNKTIPKLIFILIPFIALLLKLLYIRNKIRFFNHIIFSLHFLSLVFLLLWLSVFGSLIIDSFRTYVFILIMVYLFFALLRVYHQKKWKTFWKFLLLFFGSLFMLGLFFLIAGSISFMMI